MSEEEDNGKAFGGDNLVPNVSEDRPLDALMPEMAEGGGESGLHRDAPRNVGDVHPRVLEVGLEEGKEWTFACWRDPGAATMGEVFGNLVEATLLKELSRPPSWEREEEREFVGLRLLTFDSLAKDTRSVVEKLGFSEVPYDPDEYSERMSAWRQEAQSAGLEVPARPVSIWHLPVARNEENASTLQSIEGELLEQLGDEVWGATPGGISRHAARILDEHVGADVQLGAEGLETFQRYFVLERPGAVRWIPPVFFQAICDFVGVVLHGKYGVRVQWGMCEPDPRGIVPPPMFRDPSSSGSGTIPIGRDVSNWCVMPYNGVAPSLAERVDELAARLKGEA